MCAACIEISETVKIEIWLNGQCYSPFFLYLIAEEKSTLFFFKVLWKN